MPETQAGTPQDIILVDFGPAPGVRGAALYPAELAERSQAAVDAALSAVQTMAVKAVSAIRKIKVSERPQKVAIEFGLKLDAESGALLARAGAEAAMKVTLSWERKEERA